MQELVNDFMNTFYGYGNAAGRYWFIGMEEGSGRDWNNDIAPRFRAWQERGARTFEDLCSYHASIGITSHWAEPVEVQSTWRRLIEAVLTAEYGAPPTAQAIAAYQAEQLGFLGGETCLMELFPLPSPKVGTFLYTRLANSQYPYFASRPKYERYVAPNRIEHLQAMMQVRGDRHVVLYGTTHMKYWNALVMNAQWGPTAHEQIRHCQLDGRNIWLIPHPNARGLRKDVYVQLGMLIGQADAQGDGGGA